MKEFWRKHKKGIIKISAWYVVAIIFAFVIPIFINWAYKTPASLSMLAMDWEGKDALSFYGSLLGAAATIIALRETIKFTRESQKEERKLSIRPYLETQKYNYTDLQKIPTNLETLFIEVNRQRTTYQASLPEVFEELQAFQKRLLSGEKIEPTDEVVFNLRVETLFQKKYLLSYEIVNCGAGNAINVDLRINGKSVIPSFCIITNQSKKIVFVLNNDLLGNTNEYSLKLMLTYSDIASLADYHQTEEIIFTNKNVNSELKTLQRSGSLLTKPIEVTKKNSKRFR